MNAIPKFNLDEYTKQQRVFPEISFEDNKAMWQKVIDEHNGYIPLTIKAVEDWTAISYISDQQDLSMYEDE